MQKSLLKAMNVIEHMTMIGNEVGVTELAKLLELNKSNVYDILVTFEHMGFVKKNEVTKRYSLGNKFLEVAHSISMQQPYRNIVRRELTMLAKATDNVCHFAIPYANKAMYLEIAAPDLLMTSQPVIGSTVELHSTCIGKAILAHLPEQRIEQVLKEAQQTSSDTNSIDTTVLQNQLRHIRRMGYSLDKTELNSSFNCIAVPIIDDNGISQGALSICGQASPLPKKRLPEFVKLLTTSANIIANTF